MVIEYFTPYQAKKGSEHGAVTLSIALGDKVAVNTILGIHTIQGGQFSLNMEDEVIACNAHETNDFPVTFCPTSHSLPDFSAVPVNLAIPPTSNDGTILLKAHAAEAFLSGKPVVDLDEDITHPPIKKHKQNDQSLAASSTATPFPFDDVIKAIEDGE